MRPGPGDRTTTRSAKKIRSEEHTSELQSQSNLVCRLLLEKKNLTLRALLIPPPLVPSIRAELQATLLNRLFHISKPLFFPFITSAFRALSSNSAEPHTVR